jgi:predicted HTH domain antitoxin
MARTRQLNIRVPEELSEELAAIAEEEGLDKADVARQMLVRSVRNHRLERAVRRYREGEITMARAAEDTGLALYDMMDELSRRNLGPGIHYSPEEMREDLARLLAETGRSS